MRRLTNSRASELADTFDRLPAVKGYRRGPNSPAVGVAEGIIAEKGMRHGAFRPISADVGNSRPQVHPHLTPCT